MRDKIIELLRSTGREGIENLITYMDEAEFFTAPCSTQHHLCKVGGLAEHSHNVFCCGTQLKDSLNFQCAEWLKMLEKDILSDSWTIVSLLHDLGKAAYHGKDNYTPNYLKSGVLSDKKPYETNPDRLYIPHEIVSLLIAKRFIELTEEEEFAIMYHNGLYVPSGRDLQGKERPLQMLLHFADMWCSRFIEKEGKDE